MYYSRRQWALLLTTCCTWWLLDQASAGTCWLSVDSSSGRCQEMLGMGMTKKECCESGRATVGWTHHDNISSGQLFYWRALAGGAPDCVACQETCDSVTCPDGKRCKLRNGRPRCVCAPDCSASSVRHRGAVCGTDGRTYRNHCAMLKYNCRHSANVNLEYAGRCQRSCDSVQCARNKHCVHDQHGLPHCVTCVAQCPAVTDERQYLCGADGVSYPSACHFRRATCLHGSSIGVAYAGRCRADLTCDMIMCPWGTRCLTDADGSRPQCISCERPCPVFDLNSGPVCGTNNVTYSNWCTMRQASCQIGIVINTKHYGQCTDSVQPPAESVEYYDDSNDREVRNNEEEVS